MNKGKWIEWGGGETYPPGVNGDTWVEVKLRWDKTPHKAPAENLYWQHKGLEWDIVAYRVCDEDSSIKDTCLKDTGVKDTNPKAFFGDSKIPLGLVPTTAIAAMSMALFEGGIKYGGQNWRATGVRASIYYHAALRHLMAWWEGEDIDPESGIPHEAKAMACLAILIDAKAANVLNDDRCYKGGYAKMVDELLPTMEKLKEMHKDKNPKHWTIKDNNDNNDTE